MRKSVDHVNQSGSAAADDVLEAMHTVMHLARARQHQAAQLGAHELTHLEGKVLGFFARHAGATQSDLVAHSGRDKGQLARLINGLRERGLLEARADEQDRRIQRLHLAATAQAQHQAMQKQRRQLAALAVSGMSAEDKKQLLALLQQVRENLERTA